MNFPALRSPSSAFRPRSSGLRLDRRGFTMVEMLVSAAISAFILAGVCSSFLMIGRTGANAQNYVDLEAQAREALEVFSREVRMAYAVASGYSANSVTLSIPDTSSSRTALAYTVTYTFDASAGTLTRTGPPIDDPAGTSAARTMIDKGVAAITNSSNVAIPFLNYYRYVTTGYSTGFTNNTAANATEIKQIEINFQIRKSATTLTTATNKVLSARFIVRNK